MRNFDKKIEMRKIKNIMILILLIAVGFLYCIIIEDKQKFAYVNTNKIMLEYKGMKNAGAVYREKLAIIPTPAPDNKLSGEGVRQVGYSDVCLNVGVCEKEKYEMQQWNIQKELSNIQYIIVQAGCINIPTPAPDNKLSGEGGWQVGYSDVCLNASVCEKEKYEMQRWNIQLKLLAALINLPNVRACPAFRRERGLPGQPQTSEGCFGVGKKATEKRKNYKQNK